MATFDYEAETVAFLETTRDKGYEPFCFGVNDYGARSKEREGCILERGRSRWEIRLAQGQQRRLLAYVNDFRSASDAVQQWLEGSCAREIVQNLSECLVTPPGATASHVITEEDCRA